MSEKKISEMFDLLELNKEANEMDIKKAYDHLIELYSKADSAEIVSLRGEISNSERKKIINDIEAAYRELQKRKEGKEEEFVSETDHQEIIFDEEETEEEVSKETDPEEVNLNEEISFSEMVIGGDKGEEDLIEPEHNGSGMMIFEDEQLPQIVMEEGTVENVSEEKNGVTVKEPEVEISGPYLKKIREEQGFKIKDVEDIMSVSSKDITYVENEKFSKLNDAGYLRWLISSYSRFLGLDEKKGAEDYMRRYRLKEKK